MPRRPRFPVQAKLAAAVSAAAAGAWLLLAEQHNGGVVAVEIAAYEDALDLGGVVFCEDMVSAAVIWSGHPKACFCPTVNFHVHAASSTFGGIEIKAYQATTAMADLSSPSIRRALLDAFDRGIYGPGDFLDPIPATDLAQRGEVKLCAPKGAP